MVAHDYASTRFSPLAQITGANVSGLRLVATFSTGVLRGHEAAPIVVGDTMYVVTPYPNIVYALDLAQPGMPRKWKFEPKPEAYAQGVACCDVVNRGLAYADGRIFLNTLDNQTIALDARNGKELWRYRSGDIHAGETRTMAPLVVNGRVFVGNSGGEYGVRGWLVALDAAKGKELWRAYSTGPDDDVLIGSDYVDGHRHIHGANLGLSATAYRRAGGFAAIPCHEDVALVRALQRAGMGIAWSAKPRVATSARMRGRAKGGFADYLAGLQLALVDAGGGIEITRSVKGILQS